MTELNIAKLPRDDSINLIAARIQEQNNILKTWASAGTDTPTFPVTDWASVQSIVRAGAASRVFAVGDQLTCKRGTQNLVWDILDFDHDVPVDTSLTHSMTLQLHDTIEDHKFDETEALFYADTELPAGTYNYTPATLNNSIIGNGVSRQFTLTSAVPQGGQICVNGSNTVATTTATVYASRTSTSILESATVSEGSGGTNLETINHISRAVSGSGNWKNSSLRQWINSAAAANAWWEPISVYDRPPSDLNSAGFLNGVDSEFISAVGKVSKRTALNTVNDSGGYKETEEMFFLLSNVEAYTVSNASDEGKIYNYYKLYSDLSASGNTADSNRQKRRINTTNTNTWYLRSPVPNDSHGVYVIGINGERISARASSTLGASPVCNIV